MNRIQCLTIDCSDPQLLAEFWSQVLEWKTTYSSEKESYIEFVGSPLVTGLIPDILFIKVPDRKTVKNRMHLDLRPDNQEAEVKRIEALGGQRFEIGQSEDTQTTWVVMADPEGNEFCVLKALDAEAAIQTGS